MNLLGMKSSNFFKVTAYFRERLLFKANHGWVSLENFILLKFKGNYLYTFCNVHNLCILSYSVFVRFFCDSHNKH